MSKVMHFSIWMKNAPRGVLLEIISVAKHIITPATGNNIRKNHVDLFDSVWFNCLWISTELVKTYTNEFWKKLL